MPENHRLPSDQVDFVPWGKDFFAYLETHKKSSNPGLLEIIYSLGDEGREELALEIFNFLRTEPYKELAKNRQHFGQDVQRVLSRAARELRRSVASLRNLQTLATDETGKTIAAGLDPHLVHLMENEILRLAKQQGLAKKAFSKKRFGVMQDLSILILLQEFVAEFGRRWNEYLPAIAIRRLRGIDIADLLEAAKAASGYAEESTFIDPAAIDRALERFRQRETNALMCMTMKHKAVSLCDNLRLRPPSGKS